MGYTDGLAQDCSNSIANTLELLQSVNKRFFSPRLDAWDDGLAVPVFLPSASMSTGQRQFWAISSLATLRDVYCKLLPLPDTSSHPTLRQTGHHGGHASATEWVVKE